MLRRISKITSIIAAPLVSKKGTSRKQRKMSEQIDWRPEAQAKRNRSGNLSKLNR